MAIVTLREMFLFFDGNFLGVMCLDFIELVNTLAYIANYLTKKRKIINTLWSFNFVSPMVDLLIFIICFSFCQYELKLARLSIEINNDH